MSLSEISLREPLWLWLALLPVILFLYALVFRSRQTNRFNDKELSPWVLLDTKFTHKGYWRYLLFTLFAWMLFALALAGPRLPEKIYQLDKQAYNQLIIMVDTSFSMAARDVKPSRIERAKLELLDLINMIDNTRVGIVVFSARPHVLLPPTFEKDQLRQAIQSLRSEWLPTAGSNLAAALESVYTLLENNNSTQKIAQSVLLVSDGDFDLESTHASMADQQGINSTLRKFSKNKIKIFSLGIGTPAATALLTREGHWLMYNNQAVTTQLNAKNLQTISAQTHGAYSKFSDSDQDWQTLYYDNIKSLDLRSTPDNGIKSTSRLVNWTELFYYPLAIALFFYIAAQLSTTKTKNINLKQSLLQLLCVMLFTLPDSSVSRAADETQNHPDYKHAYTLYNDGQYQAAKQIFTRLTGYQARMGEANAAYQLKQYPLAAALYIQANLDTENDQHRAIAIFNLANSYYRMTEYEQAARLYKDTLRYDPDIKVAEINYTYAISMAEKKRQRLLEENPVANRSGTGPRRVDVEDNVEVNSGRLTLSDKEKKTDFFGNATNNTQAPTTTILSQARPASQNIELQDDTSWTYSVTDINAITQQQKQIIYDESVFWQRLFEQEEGFPAPVKSPHTLPGVKPW